MKIKIEVIALIISTIFAISTLTIDGYHNTLYLLMILAWIPTYVTLALKELIKYAKSQEAKE